MEMNRRVEGEKCKNWSMCMNREAEDTAEYERSDRDRLAK